MVRIKMKVMIRNESNANLLFAGEKLEHGSYTSGWHPPAIIEAGATKGFQGEGDNVELLVTQVKFTGTEGRVRYTIEGEPGEIYIHWNSPLVESQYANTFHIFAPPEWNVSHTGGQGGNATLDIRVRRTAQHTVRNFHPKTNGLSFSNSWRGDLDVMSVGFLWNELVKSLPGPLGDLGVGKVIPEKFLSFTKTSHGLCGGMVFAVMDYFHHNILPPNQRANPIASNDPLFLFIRERLWDSFDVTGRGHRFLAYSSPHYPNGDEGVIQNILGLAKGRSWVTFREEWPRIQADIDVGKLSPVGLIQTDNLDIGKNHQVLAYGYKKSGQAVTLLIYDPNFPQDEVVLTFNVTSTTGEVHIDRFVNGVKHPPKNRIFGFFKIDGYQPKKPPSAKSTAFYAGSGNMAVVSRIPDSMEAWWIPADGSVQGAYWYEGKGWKRYQLAPPGSASPHGSIAAISRVPHSMEVWWVGKDGSVQDAYWYEGKEWQRFQLAPPRSAAPKGGIAAVSRMQNTMEVWWIGENGSVQDAYWYEGAEWKRYELAPAGSASKTAGISALSRVANSMEIWWIGPKGEVTGAYWYEGAKGFQRYGLPTAGNASVSGAITALSRIPNSMEVWWIGTDGSVQAAYWYEGSTWKRYELAPPKWADPAGNLTAVSRDPQNMHVFWVGSDGLIKSKLGTENGKFSWTLNNINSTRKADPAGGLSVVSRIINSQEVFWTEKDGSVEAAYRYYAPPKTWTPFKLADGPKTLKERIVTEPDKIEKNNGSIPSFRRKR